MRKRRASNASPPATTFPIKVHLSPLFSSRLTGDAKRRARVKFRSAAPSSKDWQRLVNSYLPEEPALSSFFVLRDKAMLVLVIKRLLAGDPRARHLTMTHLERYDPQLSQGLVMVCVYNEHAFMPTD